MVKFGSTNKMEPQELVFKKSAIAYYRFGAGPKLVVCFHGYGEGALAFSFLTQYREKQYTFLAIDLPFHGKTEWNEGLDFTYADLQQIAQKIIAENNLQSKGSQKITLLGFSLGGRVALSFYELNPETVDRIVLLAPDGLKINFWYWLSTQTIIGNRLFAFTMKHPGWFLGFLKLLNKLRLINASIFKFVTFYIGNAEVRRLLYQRWTCLRKLKPSLKKIKAFVRQQDTTVRLVYGKHDRIILSVVGEKFRKGIEQQCSLAVIPSGHQVLHEKHAEYIIAALQQ